jgi:hypothetical protein
MDPAAMMVKRMARFLGAAVTMMEVVGETAAWS